MLLGSARLNSRVTPPVGRHNAHTSASRRDSRATMAAECAFIAAVIEALRAAATIRGSGNRDLFARQWSVQRPRFGVRTPTGAGRPGFGLAGSALP